MKDGVHLVAVDRSNKVVLDIFVDIHKYYDGLHPVIDSNDFRRRQGIVKLTGTVYDTGGRVEEVWENLYTSEGKLVR